MVAQAYNREIYVARSNYQKRSKALDVEGTVMSRLPLVNPATVTDPTRDLLAAVQRDLGSPRT